MSEEIASHSEEITPPSETQGSTVEDAFAAFGLTAPEKQESAPQGESVSDSEEEAPAIEQPTEPKTYKVKHNKEEVEVDISTDEKLTDHLQRSLALDKERDRRSELEKNLDRAAKLAGYQNHADFIANLDKIEKQQQQVQQDQFEQSKQKIIDDLVYNGVDEQTAKEYAENNPLVVQAKEALQRDQEREVRDKQAESERQHTQKWAQLYESYPDLIESAKVFGEGGAPEWFTPDMQARIDRGYDPIDAYELAHRGSIRQQIAQKTQQRAIKDQMLGKRSQVEAVTTADTEPSVPDYLASAFSAFGLPVSAAKKHIKK